MKSISLAEMDSVALLNRIDNKYVLNEEQLALIVDSIAENYFVLEIDGHRVFTYENNYFDTKDLRFYYDHHNGYVNRIKVRSRKYLETNSSFFEIKKKEKVDRTNKIRVSLDDILTELDNEKSQTVRSFSRKSLDDLCVILNNRFNRVTFINKNFTERMTLDFNIQFSDNRKTKEFNKFYVLEIKQSKSSSRSPITEQLKKNNIREQSFSKYIFGVLSLNKNVRRNNFLPILKNIEKI
ncbi:MAG: polyphosphate polymerase domain-containing protein [Flavobacteriaceae bacterium]